MARAWADELRAEGTEFERVVRERSEDVTTRETRGSLGGVDADLLADWPQILDAAAALRDGETSLPVETEWGFHILSRRPPPRAQRASGRRIVIAYDEAPWLPTFLAERPVEKRSRDEAAALAARVYERARSDPEDFPRLVREYSDHQDVARGGDFGVWSSVEGARFARETEHLFSVAEGEVARPIDTLYGFQIIQRLPPRPRTTYRAALIQLTTELDAGKVRMANNAAAWKQLQAAASVLAREPQRFGQLQAELCCPGYVEQWEEGRGSVRAERALSSLELGQISGAPVRLGPARLALLRRLAPEPIEPLPVVFELPAPEHVDALAYCAETGRLELLQRAMEQTVALAALDTDWGTLSAAWSRAEDASARRALIEQLLAGVLQRGGAGVRADLERRLMQLVEDEALRPGPIVW